MPELPEVEVVRRGLADHVVGRHVTRARITGVRVARRHDAGPEDLAARLHDVTVTAASRRGKYLWLALDGEDALIVHLGMSGQMLVEPADAPLEKHCHARFDFADDGPQLRFVDQRTFGGLALSPLRPDGIPESVAHIAPDPFEPVYDQAAVVRRMKQRDSAVKRALLDQSLVSGIGNIYADEALWRAKVHGERLCSSLTKPTLSAILDRAREVMAEALGQGGTSFDSLYVNVNGASGYFDRSLHAYGRAGTPCDRCGTIMRREQFMNRSSFSCPVCQPRPRRRSRVLTVGNGGRATASRQVGPSANRAGRSAPRRATLRRGTRRVVVDGLDVRGHDDRLDPRPDEEERAHEEQDDAGPQVGVDATGLLQRLVPEDAHDEEDQAVEAQQGADEVADVEGARGVLLAPRAVGVRRVEPVVVTHVEAPVRTRS